MYHCVGTAEKEARKRGRLYYATHSSRLALSGIFIHGEGVLEVA